MQVPTKISGSRRKAYRARLQEANACEKSVSAMIGVASKVAELYREYAPVITATVMRSRDRQPAALTAAAAAHATLGRLTQEVREKWIADKSDRKYKAAPSLLTAYAVFLQNAREEMRAAAIELLQNAVELIPENDGFRTEAGKFLKEMGAPLPPRAKSAAQNKPLVAEAA